MALDPRLIRNAVAEDPARGVGGVAPTYEVQGVWVAGRRGRSAPDADRIPVPHRRSGLRPRRLLIRRLIRNAVAADPARSVGGVAPTSEVRGVWVAGLRGRSPAPHAFLALSPHRPNTH